MWRLAEKVLVLVLIFMLSLNGWANPIKPDSSSTFLRTTFGLFFSQHCYSKYFKGGGRSSVALGGHIDTEYNHQKSNHHWENRLQIRYGVIKMSELPVQKNEDLFQLDSKFGHQVTKNLKISALFGISTRLHDIYEIDKEGHRGKRIGNFLSPLYVNLGSGIDYFTKGKWLSIFYTPVNSKFTHVSDSSLVPQYFPQNETGKKSRYELGSLLRFEIKKEIMQNIFLHTVGSFFTNHLDDFGIFDVNVESILKLRVNKHLSVNLLTHLVYDQDILFDIPIEDGENVNSYKAPRTQFKEVLNVGLTHSI